MTASHASIGAFLSSPRVTCLKKSFVALLIALALIVLISPGIVGRLAEQSMDENLDWAASENQDLAITSQGFDRGWFSSEGQHRIEITDGELRDFLLSFTDAQNPGDVPALIIDTRLDHGLIPFSSMARKHGTLRPGLGSAVSTLRVAFANGDALDLPGAIYSNVGITGELKSNYLVEPGSIDVDGVRFRWGDSDILLTSNPADGRTRIRGALDAISIEARNETIAIGAVKVFADQVPGRFGFPVGSISASVASIDVTSAGDSMLVGPLDFATSASIAGDRISGETRLRLDNAPLEPFGAANIVVELRLENVDGMAFGRIQRSLRTIPAELHPGAAMAAIEADVQQLLAAGLQLHVAHLDVELPSGTIATTSNIVLGATDPQRFTWVAALLALDATLDVAIPEDVMDFISAWNNTARAAVGLGYLQKNGTVYESHVEVSNGVLTINGAPMQIPLSGLR